MGNPKSRERHGEWMIATYDYGGSVAYVCSRNVSASKQFKKAVIKHTGESVSFFPVSGSNYTIDEVKAILDNHIDKVTWDKI